MIEITICSGTLCYIMGGAELFEIEEKLTSMFKLEFKVNASPCLGACQGDDKQKPPCIKVNNALLAEASIDSIINYLKKEVRDGRK